MEDTTITLPTISGYGSDSPHPRPLITDGKDVNRRTHELATSSSASRRSATCAGHTRGSSQRQQMKRGLCLAASVGAVMSTVVSFEY